MQQFFSTLPLGAEPVTQIVVYAVVAVALLVALFILYRVLFAHRLRLPGGGRARQPRLGLVDAFSLDGQRQLVLVRRDNIEHLVMIGGPNDVVIESQIVRAAVAASVPPAARERDQAPGASPASPAARPQPAIAVPPARLPPRPEPAPAKPVSIAATTAPPPPGAPPRAEPPKTLTVLPAKPAAPPPPLAPARPPPPTPRTTPLPAPIGANTAPPAPRPASPPAKPGPEPAPPQSASVASAPSSAPMSPPANELGSKRTGAGERANGGEEFAGLDSLEAEMSRLLGREN